MNMNDFASKMQELLDMQSNYQRIRSENLLFRQQIDDLKIANNRLVEDHQEELSNMLSSGTEKKQTATNEMLDDIRSFLEGMNDHIQGSERDSMDNATCSSSSYYIKEANRIAEEWASRHKKIQMIMNLLENSLTTNGES